MGVVDPEKQPLVAQPDAAKEPRQWKGPWHAVGGDFSGSDVAACCLAWNAPHVAFGWNASRGLGQSWWKEALKLMLLTCGIFAVVRLALFLLVETACHPHPDPMPRNMPYKILDGATYNPSFAAGANAVAAGANLRGASADPAAAVTVAASTTASSLTAATQTVGAAVKPLDLQPAHLKHSDEDDEDDDDDQPEQPEQDDDDEDEDNDEHREHHPFWPHHHHDQKFDFHHHHGPMGMSEEEVRDCAMRVGPFALLISAFGMAVFVYAAYYAALRRQMIREKFGIEGTFRSDFLLWLGCAPCALTQETRTLMHNNVESGYWHGPLMSAPAPVAPMAV